MRNSAGGLRFRLPDALPPLRGWAATLYVAIWLPLLAVTLWTTVGSAWYGTVDGVGDAYSWHALGINRDNNDNSLIDATAGDEARRAGVRPGDRMLAIDGIALPPGSLSDAQDWYFKAHLLHARGPVRIALQTGKAPPRTVMLTRSAEHGEALYAGTGLTPTSLSWLGTLTNLLAPVILITGACLLFARRRDAVAALLSVALLGLAAATPYAQYYLIRFDAVWVTGVMNNIGGVCLMLTMLVFPSGRFVPRWTLWVILAFPALVAISILVPAIGTWAVRAIILLALAAMIVRYRREAPADRRQWRWAMIGFVAGMAIIFGPGNAYGRYLASPEALANFGATLWSWILTPLSVSVPDAIIAAGVVLSVLRYRLYDTQAAVSRSILYGMLTLALLAIFAGSEKIIEIIGEEYFGESIGALAGGLGAAFAAVAIAPLHHRIGHFVEHRFRKNLIHLRHDLPPLLTELGETSDPETVARTTLYQLAHGLHATRGAVVANGAVLAAHNIDRAAVQIPVDSGAKRIGTLELHKGDPLFPVRLPLAADGARVLLIGPRPDDSLYDRQERELLSELASPLAQALRVADDRAARETAIAARFDLIERALRALQGGISRSEAAE